MIASKDEVIKIDTVNDKGNKVEYDVILMYDSEVTGKRYCFYTDGSKTPNGSLTIRAGSVGQLAGDIVMEEITNPVEREMVARDYNRFMEEKSK